MNIPTRADYDFLWQQILALKKRLGGFTTSGGGSGISQLTGDVTAGPGTGSQAATIAADAVTNAKLANVPAATFKGGEVGAGTANPTDMDPDEASLVLDTAADPFVRTSAVTGGSPSIPLGGGNIFPDFTTPVDGDFAWVNQGGASTTVNANGGIALIAPANGGNNMRIRKRAVPSAPYVRTIAFMPSLLVTVQDMGMILRDSGTGNLVRLAIAVSTGPSSYLLIQRFSSPTVFVSTQLTVQGLPIWGLVYLRITDNNTNRIFSVSYDGYTFTDLFSESRTTYITPDEIGFYAEESSNVFQTVMTVLSWE